MHQQAASLLIAFLGASLMVTVCNAEAQFGFPIYQPSFRAGLPISSLSDVGLPPQQGRMFFTTITVTFATTTSTFTSTTSTTCTTSTAGIKSCSPSKGRRRRSHIDVSGLLYNEDEDEDGIDSNIFLVPDKKKIDPVRVEREAPIEKSTMIPFVVEPGFRVPRELNGSGRFLLAVGTTTLKTTTTSTYAVTLTATCKSSTGFQSCSPLSSGKK